MTNFVSTYNFMDLLKDKGIAPQTDVNSNDYINAIFDGLVGKLSARIELPVEDHDFMDLMHDKGFVPEPSNDNIANVRIVA